MAASGDLAYAFTLDAPAEPNGYRIDFYRNGSPDPSGFGEGERWLGFIDTPTHPGGAVAYSGSFTPDTSIANNNRISATATRKTGPSTYAETSEFNQNATVVTPLTVTNTNDAGAGSVRAAIEFANTQVPPLTIRFAIPGAGPHMIALASPLPVVTVRDITIDGATQPGSQCRDLWLGNGHDLRIQLQGSPAFNGLQLNAANPVVRGLSITGFATGIELQASSNNAQVRCSYIGLRPDGSAAGNEAFGVSVGGVRARVGQQHRHHVA